MRNLILILALLLSTTLNAATPTANLDAVTTGLWDQALTAQQKTDIADAFVATLTDQQIVAQFGAGKTRLNLTNAERATVVLRTIRRSVRNMVKENGRGTAAASAQATIEAAANTAGDSLCVEPC